MCAITVCAAAGHAHASAAAKASQVNGRNDFSARKGMSVAFSCRHDPLRA
jgi:hypothetical protein